MSRSRSAARAADARTWRKPEEPSQATCRRRCSRSKAGLSSAYKFCPACAKPLAAGEYGAAQRLGCDCGFVHWDNPLPVVAAIVEHEGGVILARNKTGADPKMFGLITGFLEKGETPEAAVAREVREELSLEAT